VADILLDGLPVLDLLEITPSTSVVARLTRRDQSSISRIYRQVSQRLGLEFRKHANGVYSAGSNQALLEALRFSSQHLRLQRDPTEPRWLTTGSLKAIPDAAHPALPEELVGPRDDLHQLVLKRILDLAVIQRPRGSPAPAPDSPLREHLLVGSDSGEELLLLRADLEAHPVIQALIATISSAYRQYQQRHSGLTWLG
jgi:hypothetical protein